MVDEKDKPVIEFHKWLRTDPTIKIKVERGQRGGYAWEITYEDKSADRAIKKIKETDEKLKAIFQEGKNGD